MPGTSVVLPSVLTLLVAAAGCATLAPAPAEIQVVSEGIYRLAPSQADALDTLEGSTVRVLILAGSYGPWRVAPERFERLRTWVLQGGVVWLEGPVAEPPLIDALAPIRAEAFHARAGLFVDRSGDAPLATLFDHELTRGVRQLFVHPRWRFDATPGVQPLVRAIAPDGERGLVLAALPLGRGMIVLDGTARSGPMRLNRLEDFDPAHPNAQKREGRWQSYDWNVLVANARDRAAAAMGDERTGSP